MTNTNHDDILNNLRLARAYCAEKLVWFAPALFRCNIILTQQVAVSAIDQDYNIYFNPVVIDKITKNHPLPKAMAQIGFIWIHEIAHLLRDHAERAKDIKAEPELWNMAADFEINDGQWKGISMPEDFPGLTPHEFNLPPNKLAEWYYYKIQKDKQLQQKCCSKCNSKGKGKEEEKKGGKGKGEKKDDESGNAKSDNENDAKKNKNDETEGQSEGDGKQNWDEGSGVHNHKRPWEEGDNRQSLHPIDKDVVARSVAEKMKESQKLIGTMPGSWGIWIEEIIQSRTDWKKLLRHRMSRAIATGIGLRVDYSFARPSRRQAVYHPIITPSFSGERSGNIAVVVDTSGSMGTNELGQAVGEVCQVLEDFKMPVTVIPCDAKVYEPIVLRKPSDRFKVRQLKGGGGTNMIIGIEAALKLKPKPDTVLVLTDGHTPYPAKPYKTPVVFGILKTDFHKESPRPKCPPWDKSSTVDILIQR